jgi:hypothetical protein
VNRAQAARDLQVARARMALLPDLPLGAGTGAPGPQQSPSTNPAMPLTPQQQQPLGGGQFRNANVQTAAGTQTGVRQ